MDATKDNGTLGRLINHSKIRANIKPKVIEVDSKPYIWFVAARKIEIGEELLYDYGERDKDVLQAFPWLKQ